MLWHSRYSKKGKSKVKFFIQSWTKYVETDCEFIQKSAELHLTKIVTKPHIYVKGTKKHYIFLSEPYINKTKNSTHPYLEYWIVSHSHCVIYPLPPSPPSPLEQCFNPVKALGAFTYCGLNIALAGVEEIQVFTILDQHELKLILDLHLQKQVCLNTFDQDCRFKMLLLKGER